MYLILIVPFPKEDSYRFSDCQRSNLISHESVNSEVKQKQLYQKLILLSAFAKIFLKIFKIFKKGVAFVFKGYKQIYDEPHNFFNLTHF